MLTEKNIGILGGGQLGKMLCEAALPWHLNIHVLDKDQNMSAAPYCTSFSSGNFKKYEDVMNFGKGMDILTIEIEHVNIDALFDLQRLGVEVRPRPEALVKIVDKGLQKQFYQENDIPTATFRLYEDKAAILKALDEGEISLPFVQKTRTEGYDGRGVQVIRDSADVGNIVDVPSVIEELVDLEKEVAVMAARNASGQIESFEPVEMQFKEGANLLDVLICPARIDRSQHDKMLEIGEKIIRALDIVGVLAIEFFLSKEGKIYVNEIAPRPHNSGHHTIENNQVSQFEQHLRAILDFPLIKPKDHSPAVMINVLGEEGYIGRPFIEGSRNLLKTEGAYFHWYGKAETKPYRKMGHITFLAEDIDHGLKAAKEIRQSLKIITKTPT
jgi:5-(carboxyamino)imidazole ribonucleotide synthase